MPCSHPSWLRATFFAPWVLLCAAPAIAGSFTYATIPPVDQDGRDLAGTIAAGINDSGVVAATADAELGVTTAVLWSPGASHVTSYQYAINDSTNFTAINDSGLVTGYYQTNPGTNGTKKFLAFVYNSANGIQQNINISSKDFAVPAGINASGQVAGTAHKPPYGLPSAFLSNNGVVTKLKPKAAWEGQDNATGINDSGIVVGWYLNKKIPRTNLGFSYNGTSYTVIAPPAGTNVLVSFITNSGTIGGTYTDASSQGHGFIFDGTTYTNVDYPGAGTSSPVGIGPGGEVVGNWSDSSGNEHGYVLTGGTFYPINLPGSFTQTILSAVNAQGTLVGTGYIGPSTNQLADTAFTATCPTGQSPCTQ